jgi:DNA-binding XRE family transcriptional regulator
LGSPKIDLICQKIKKTLFHLKTEENIQISTIIQVYRINIGYEIKNFREKKGYSQDELAEIMNVNRSTTSIIENGKSNLSINYLSNFSWFLGFEFQLKENKNIKSVNQI